MSKNFKPPEYNTGETFSAPLPNESDYDKEHPVFCFKHLADCKHYGIEKCKNNDKALLIDAIYKRSKFTWSDIKLQKRTKYGFEMMEKKALQGIPKCCPHDGKFMIFRTKTDTTSRIIGFRTNNIYHMVLYDKSGKSYSHG